jgi:zinc transporter ZupT
MGRIADNILPPLIGIVCGILFAKYDIITYANSENLIEQFPTIGTWIFGFILTTFSIIVQGNNEVVARMKKSRKAFSRFVKFSLKVAMLSMIATLYSYFVGYYEFTVSSNLLNLLAVFFCSILVWLTIEVFYFLIVFYLLLQGEIKTKSDDRD